MLWTWTRTHQSTFRIEILILLVLMQKTAIPTILEELRFIGILAAFVLLMIPHTVDADQKTPELDQLFLQLEHSTNPSQATTLEKRYGRSGWNTPFLK